MIKERYETGALRVETMRPHHETLGRSESCMLWAARAQTAHTPAVVSHTKVKGLERLGDMVALVRGNLVHKMPSQCLLKRRQLQQSRRIGLVANAWRVHVADAREQLHTAHARRQLWLLRCG